MKAKTIVTLVLAGLLVMVAMAAAQAQDDIVELKSDALRQAHPPGRRVQARRPQRGG